ncbi:MAG: HU family DNA-binding protein [Alistipes sp.]|jgi:DNA-binding protein HU-beta|nr:HU family DNA-binding protein [Alistipes sp.]
MNKIQLVDAIVHSTGCPKANVKKCIDAFLAVASETLREGDKITLSGFGTFQVVKSPTRMGRNFLTGTPVEIPARSVVKFRQSFDMDAL